MVTSEVPGFVFADFLSHQGPCLCSCSSAGITFVTFDVRTGWGIRNVFCIMKTWMKYSCALAQKQVFTLFTLMPKSFLFHNVCMFTVNKESKSNYLFKVSGVGLYGLKTIAFTVGKQI